MPVGKKSIQRAIDAQNRSEKSRPGESAAPKKEQRVPEFAMVALSAIDVEGRTGVYDRNALTNSVRTYGVIEPVLLVSDGKVCRLADGYGRYLAAKELGMERIPAVIIEGSRAAYEKLLRELASTAHRAAAGTDDIHEEKFRVISRISSEVPVELL